MLVNYGPSQLLQSHGNEVLQQDATQLLQRPCYQRRRSAKLQQATGPDEYLLTIIKRCSLRWYGHISHVSGLAKTIWQDTVKEGRRQGRERKRWEDNVREWTGPEFTKSQRAMENREKWRKHVVKSSVAPQWPSWLRDR